MEPEASNREWSTLCELVFPFTASDELSAVPRFLGGILVRTWLIVDGLVRCLIAVGIENRRCCEVMRIDRTGFIVPLAYRLSKVAPVQREPLGGWNGGDRSGPLTGAMEEDEVPPGLRQQTRGYLILSVHLVMNDDEAYILLLLSDSNLPTGSFVASSGLESYVKHGFASSPDSATINFVRDSLVSYAHSALPFVSDAHRAVSRLNLPDSDNKNHSVVVDSLSALDSLYDTMTLNHVAKRASKSQGIALLSLYSRGFSRPSSLSSFLDEDMESHQSRMKNLFEGFKLRVRKEEGHGHLPVCWGALTAALGLTLGMQTRTT